MNKIDELYKFIGDYASEKQLENVLRALPLVREKLSNVIRRTFHSDNKGTTSCEHCLETTRFLMDLHVPFDSQGEDILLASMLCHDMLENVRFPQGGEELVTDYRLAPEVLEVVRLMTRPQYMSEKEKEEYYGVLKKNKLAVLVTLADRSNLVEQMTGVSITEANDYVTEMRKYILPLCVYAKEYYPDCQMTVTIMMEKIRCLIDVSDIISNRYEKRELAYANEILQLLEENARLRGLIHEMEAKEE